MQAISLAQAVIHSVQSNTPLQATGYLTLAAVAKCLQAATWLVARGNKVKIQ